MTDLRAGAAALRQTFTSGNGGGKQPPQESGKRLARIERGDDALHLTWQEYEGREFLRLQPWKKGGDGNFWPVKGQGFTIRVHELPDFAEGIAAAMDLAQQFQSKRQQGDRGQTRRQEQPRHEYRSHSETRRDKVRELAAGARSGEPPEWMVGRE